jgi:hypothetical protein
MKRCPVTGRIHRTPRELATELARLDRQILTLHAIEAQFQAGFTDTDGTIRPVPDAVSTAWNAVHDAIDALARERVDAEMNPRPIPAGEAGTYALIKDNID